MIYVLRKIIVQWWINVHNKLIQLKINKAAGDDLSQ